MTTSYPKPPFPDQKQASPGVSDAMDPPPDYGEASYLGSGRLAGKRAIITGADSGIGRAVALAYAREGADVLVSYYNEDDDAAETRRLVEGAGRKAILMGGDIQDPAHCRAIVDKAVEAWWAAMGLPTRPDPPSAARMRPWASRASIRSTSRASTVMFFAPCVKARCRAST